MLVCESWEHRNWYSNSEKPISEIAPPCGHFAVFYHMLVSICHWFDGLWHINFFVNTNLWLKDLYFSTYLSFSVILLYSLSLFPFLCHSIPFFVIPSHHLGEEGVHTEEPDNELGMHLYSLTLSLSLCFCHCISIVCVLVRVMVTLNLFFLYC